MGRAHRSTRKIRLRRILIILLGALLPALKAHASPWARNTGELFVVSRADYFAAGLTPETTASGLVENRFERVDSHTYLEYGLLPDFTIGGKAIYGTAWLTRSTSIETAAGFSEIDIFGRYQILRSSKHAGAIQITGVIPFSFQSGVRPGLESNGADLDIAFLYGRNMRLGRGKTFFATELGFRKRISDSADQIRTRVTFGYEPNDRWLLLMDAFGTLSLRNESIGGADYDIFKIQPSLVLRAGRKWSVQIGATEEISGRNIALGRTVFIGLWSVF